MQGGAAGARGLVQSGLAASAGVAKAPVPFWILSRLVDLGRQQGSAGFERFMAICKDKGVVITHLSEELEAMQLGKAKCEQLRVIVRQLEDLGETGRAILEELLVH